MSDPSNPPRDYTDRLMRSLWRRAPGAMLRLALHDPGLSVRQLLDTNTVLVKRAPDGAALVDSASGPFIGHIEVEVSPGADLPLRVALYGLLLHEQHGLPVTVVQGNFTEESGYEAAQGLLQSGEPPEAVFCANDQMAIGFLRAMRERGLQAPADIAVAGFDDIPLASAAEPPLTTVHQPIEQLGYLAASTLIDLLENASTRGNGAEVRRIVLPTELVVRASCGNLLRHAAGSHSLPSNGSPKGGVKH